MNKEININAELLANFINFELVVGPPVSQFPPGCLLPPIEEDPPISLYAFPPYSAKK